MLPTSGAMSLYAIQQEFGGAASPVPLNAYYRGGANVNSITLAGSGSFQGPPLASVSPLAIPTSGSIQLSEFYGTQSLIVGGGVPVYPPVGDPTTTNFYQDVTIPAGVDLIRLYLLGAGGGGAGYDAGHVGGNGGGGSLICGTFSTAWAGSIASARILRFFIGQGGSAGKYATSNTITYPIPAGGNGYPMNGMTSGLWTTWMNTYSVTIDTIGTSGYDYTVNNARIVRWIKFPNSGTYTFQFQADNYLTIAVDGTSIANTSGLNDTAYNGGNSGVSGYVGTGASPLTKTVTLAAGWHSIEFLYTNGSLIGGFASRIVNNTTSTELWNSRNSASNNHGVPCGGNGGTPGSSGSSGQGGGGGAATFVTIINGSGTEYFFALAGGGAGGGGSGQHGYIGTANQNANWFNQCVDSSGTTQWLWPGGEGECPAFLANRTFGGFSDGGAGGGGGGGAANNRSYITSSAEAPHSGLGGRYSSWGTDYSADGGESGKSAITPSTTKYADFVHAPTTGQYPISPSWATAVLPGPYASQGIGGNGQETSGGFAVAGSGGFAFVDWGYTTAAVAAPTITYAAIRGNIISYYLGTGFDVQGGDNLVPNPMYFDAFGGGGNTTHISEYTYSWSGTSSSGAAPTITTVSTGRVQVVDGAYPGVGAATFTLNCTISDGINSTVVSYTWNWLDTGSTLGSGGGGTIDTCFPAGAMITMADNTTVPIETIKIGDLVMGPNGATSVLRLGKPLLGTRKLLGFSDGHKWTEDHAHWTKAADNSQWWWNYNPTLWLTKVTKGTFGGLTDNSTMRTGVGYQYAHISGWKTDDVLEVASTPDMQMYLPLTDGTPIIVDGYVVGAGIDERGFDYSKLDWDKAFARFPSAVAECNPLPKSEMPAGLLPPPEPLPATITPAPFYR